MALCPILSKSIFSSTFWSKMYPQWFIACPLLSRMILSLTFQTFRFRYNSRPINSVSTALRQFSYPLRVAELEEQNESLREQVEESNNLDVKRLADSIQKWIVEEYSQTVQAWITEEFAPEHEGDNILIVLVNLKLRWIAVISKLDWRPLPNIIPYYRLVEFRLGQINVHNHQLFRIGRNVLHIYTDRYYHHAGDYFNLLIHFKIKSLNLDFTKLSA
jgi:hypothetical protein